jgi:hypothetical protein
MAGAGETAGSFGTVTLMDFFAWFTGTLELVPGTVTLMDFLG